MAYYVLLTNFTDQGVKTVKDTVKRAEAFKEMAAKSGVKVHSLFWTLGQYDVVAIAEADDDIAATALGCRSRRLVTSELRLEGVRRLRHGKSRCQDGIEKPGGRATARPGKPSASSD